MLCNALLNPYYEAKESISSHDVTALPSPIQKLTASGSRPERENVRIEYL